MRTLGKLLAMSIAIVSIARSATPAKNNVPPQICQTPECLALSALITRNMNMSADPCEDFNAYACGNYRVNNLYDPANVLWSKEGKPLLTQKGLTSIRNQLKRRLFELLYFPPSLPGDDEDVGHMQSLASNLFRSCIGWAQRKRTKSYVFDRDEEAALVFYNGLLSHLLESIGEWEASTESSGWFERTLGKMVRVGDWRTISVYQTDVSPYRTYNSSAANSAIRVRLRINSDNLPTSNASNYTKFFSKLLASSYLKFDNPEEFEAIGRYLQSFNNIASNSTTDINNFVHCSEVNNVGENNLTTIRDLENLSKCIDPSDPFSWSIFFDSIIDGKANKDMLIRLGRSKQQILIAVNFLTYFKKRSLSSPISSISSSWPKFSTQFSYLVFDWLLTFYEYLPRNLAAQWESKVGRGFRYEPPFATAEDAFKECAVLTKKLLGPVVDRMFQKAYHEKTFDHVRELVGLVQNATIESVRKETWITPSSKEAIIEKIMSIRRVIGFDEISTSGLKKHYASTIRSLKRGSANVTSYRDFGSLFSLALCAYAGKQNLLSVPDEWWYIMRDSLIVNAFNAMESNQIIFPMGILSPFLYHKSYPDYMNLGGIGVIIGHEIGHGFDNLGHQLNKDGARGHFWDNETEAGYLERMKCVTTRFGSYEMVPGQLHKPEPTVGNDISDLMGIRSAFGALKLLGDLGSQKRLPNLPESLTPEKLFFVQAAQAWCDKSEPEALVEMFKQSAHSPSHIRIRGMMENSRDFAQVFQCRRGQAMNPSNKCEFW